MQVASVLAFPLNKMGVVVEGRDPKIVLLHNYFVVRRSRELHISRGFAERRPRATNICCPFCKTGFLRLDTVVYCYGEGDVLLSLIHTKDRHYFHCSNPDCGAVFVGESVYALIN